MQLLVVVVDINNFNSAVTAVNKNRPVAAGDTKAVNPQVPRLEHFGVKAGMERVCFKQSLLFFEPGSQPAFLQIHNETLAKRANLHRLLNPKIRGFLQSPFQAL